MKVEKLMASGVGVCGLEDDLTKVVAVMREKDCGVVPVVDAENRLVGVITDRDVCFAVGTKKLAAVKAREVIDDKTFTACAPDDEIKSALRKMRKHQLKRLPVVAQSGEIVGILSISDVLLKAGKDKKLKKQVYKTLESIYAPRPIVLKAIDAGESANTGDDRMF